MSVDLEATWKQAAGFRKVAPQLRPLLVNVTETIAARQSDGAVRAALDDLLSFLVTAEGRTDANCSVTDAWFALLVRSELGWSHLPAPLQSILDDLSGALHDTVHAPWIAETFACTPERLLERLRAAAIE